MYNKLFTKILDSSIWLESHTTRIVWLTLLAAMDQDGFAQFASPANLAHRARVELPACLAAIERLEGSPEAARSTDCGLASEEVRAPEDTDDEGGDDK